ncbi:hypothetical protein BH09MYX1_BH09MYX1_65600 [soil metagenome]
MGRSVDAGGSLWVGAPDDDDVGVSVLARFETLDVERCSVVLAVQTGERDDEDGARYPTSDPMLLTCILDTGECTPDEPAASSFLADHPWFEDEFQSHMDHVRQRAWRAIAQRDRETAARRELQAATGTMISFQRLFPADWDLAFGVEGAIYWVVDQYCPNPACACSSVALSLYQLRDGNPIPLGEALVDLASESPDLEIESVTTEGARELFDTFWHEQEDRLRQRREEARRVVLRYAARPAEPVLARAPSTTSRPTRNDPCPCGSGKKYKRCCLIAAGGSPALPASRS